MWMMVMDGWMDGWMDGVYMLYWWQRTNAICKQGHGVSYLMLFLILKIKQNLKVILHLHCLLRISHVMVGIN